jgi:hypothetical protein
MAEYRKQHPVCEWDHRTTPVEVHHIEPIQFAPERAADPTNFISLGARRNHLVVGHAGDWKQYVSNVRELCDTCNVVTKLDTTEQPIVRIQGTRMHEPVWYRICRWLRRLWDKLKGPPNHSGPPRYA